MLSTWIALLGTPAAAQSLQISVTDPLVIAVVLECADGSHKAVVKSGLATLEQTPEACTVHMIRRGGTIDAPGAWTCGLDTCSQDDVDHRPVTDADGRVNIVATTDLPAGSAMELTCAAGFRERVSLVQNTAVFENVPDEECTLHFKGGVPAKFRPIRWGTFYCGLSGSTAVCTQR